MNVTDPSQALARRWFQKTENDLLNVENNLKAARYPADTVCFHCQQAAEKHLKGFLAWHQVPFVKIHDLLELDQYAVQIRYPQEYGGTPNKSEVQAAVSAAYTVRKWVRQSLKLEEPQ